LGSLRRIRLVLARGSLGPLRFARALGFACAAPLRFATAHFSAITRLPSGASPSRLHRHLPTVRLVSRHFPPLHVALCRFGSRAAPTLGCSSAVRCVLHSRMHAAWLGVEYHILRQSAHLRGALRIPSLERSRVSCRASPCSVALSVATFPICYCGASCAL
jgi:hypothetical protein